MGIVVLERTQQTSANVELSADCVLKHLIFHTQHSKVVCTCHDLNLRLYYIRSSVKVIEKGGVHLT